MKLTEDTTLGPRAATRPTLVDWPKLAKTKGRVWELTAPDDFEAGRARAVAESARAWGKRHNIIVTARVIDGGNMKVMFSRNAKVIPATADD